MYLGMRRWEQVVVSEWIFMEELDLRTQKGGLQTLVSTMYSRHAAGILVARGPGP